jgi:hypothetical protein
LTVGISKRELLEDYYIDEIPEIIKAWNSIHGSKEEHADGYVAEINPAFDPSKSFGKGGEILG